MKSFCAGVSKGDFPQGEGDWSRLVGREILASRTELNPCRRREREGTYVIQGKLSGMDSTLPHLTDSREHLFGL